MRIKVKAKNFLGYGEKGFEVNYSTLGITFIKGLNISSRSKSGNGAGKSLIFETLFYGLYGKPTRIKKSELLNLEVQKDLEVETIIEKNNHVAKIIRRQACKDFDDGIYLWIDNIKVTLKKEKDLQAKITEFIGLDRDVFVSAVWFSSSEETSYAGETSGNQDKILTKLMALEPFDVARTNARKERVRVEECIDSIDISIKQESLLLEENQKQYVALDEIYENWIVKQEERKTSIQDSIDKHKDIFCSTLEEYKITKDGLDVLEISANKMLLLSVLEEKLDLLSLDKEKVEEELRVWNKEAGKLEGRVEDIKDKLSLTQAIDGENQCPACGAALTKKSLDSYASTLYDKLVKYEKIYEEHKLTRDKFDKKLTDCKKQSQAINAEIQRNMSIAQEISRLTNYLLVLQTKENDTDLYIKVLFKTLEDIQEEEPPTEDALKELNCIKAEREVKVKELELEKEKYTPFLNIYGFWEWGFSSSGIKNYLIGNILPELNELTIRYSEILTQGELSVHFSPQDVTVAGETKNRLCVEIEDIYGSNSYYTSSGGERRRIDLIVTLALNSLIAQRRNIGFCVIDEALVKLDEIGKESVIGLLREMEKTIPTIFVISNQADVLSQSFDRVWTAVREGQQSRLEKRNV